MKTFPCFRLILIWVLLLLIKANLSSQPQYGSLEYLILIDGSTPAIYVPALAVDPELNDTTEAFTNQNGLAVFDSLYIYNLTGTEENDALQNAGNELTGPVKIYSMNGQGVGVGKVYDKKLMLSNLATPPPGIYIAVDENGRSKKFFHQGHSTFISQNISAKYKHQNFFTDSTRTYHIIADGTNLEFEPFATSTDTVELGKGLNEHSINVQSVPDTPVEGTIEILVNGQPAQDGSLIKIFKEGTTDTTFLATVNGQAAFTTSDGIKAHPFDTYTRAYQSIINGNFIPDTNTLNIALNGNNFQFNPQALPVADGIVTYWHNMTTPSDVNVKAWRLINPTDTNTYITNSAGWFAYDNLPVNGPTQYVFSSFKDDGVNPVLVSLDTATLVAGNNPLLNFYLQEIAQLFNVTGTVRHHYDQSQAAAGVGMFIQEQGTGIVIDSAVTNQDGFYSLHNIPAGLVGELVLASPDTNIYFHRRMEYILPEFVQSYTDTLIANQNRTIVPRIIPVPKTANDPSSDNIQAVDFEIAEWVGTGRINGEEAAQFKNNLYLTNFQSPGIIQFHNALLQAIDSLYYWGQGSPLVIVSTPPNITSYHQQNYYPGIVFPDDPLGWTVTQGNGNTTFSTNSVTGYTIGGHIDITGGAGALDGPLKEYQHRRNQRGDVTSRPSTGNPNATMPNEKDRAYELAVRINDKARVEGFDISPLNDLTTSITEQNMFSSGAMQFFTPYHFLDLEK